MRFWGGGLDQILRHVSVGVLALAVVGTMAEAAQEPPHSAELDRMIVAAAKRNGVPERLVRRIIMRESKYNPRARNHLYWGLMQISYPTAKSMGFTGTREQLLDPLVNLRYAVPYLANAFLIAGKQDEAAVRLYAAGYYNTAKSRGVLGLLRTADSPPAPGVMEEPAPQMVATAAPAQPEPVFGIFGALGSSQQFAPQPAPTAPAPTVAAAQSQGPAAVEAPGMSAAHHPAPVVAMVANKSGDLAPPKKWQHDGGMTTIAKGEQGVEQIAAYAGVAPSTSKNRSKKSTEFAALETPASAQAYAAQQSQQSSFAQAAPQAAIAEATASQQPAGFALAEASQPATAQQAPQAAPSTVQTQIAAATPEPSKKKSRSARRHHHDSDGTTAVAKSDVGQSQHAATPEKQGDTAPVVAQQTEQPPALRQ